MTSSAAPPGPPPAPPSGVYARPVFVLHSEPRLAGAGRGWQVPSRVNRLSINHKTHWSTMDLIYWRMFSTQSKPAPVSRLSKTTQLLIVVMVATPPPPHQNMML